jgi:hypothetical protein
MLQQPHHMHPVVDYLHHDAGHLACSTKPNCHAAVGCVGICAPYHSATCTTLRAATAEAQGWRLPAVHAALQLHYEVF